MNAVPHGRGLDLLAAHLRSLDPASPPARERLDGLIGRDLAQLLVFGLSGGGEGRRERRDGLGARAVLAA